MAAKLGVITSGIIGKQEYLSVSSTDLDNYTEATYNPTLFDVVKTGLYAVRNTVLLAKSNRWNVQGNVINSFFQDFYFRVYATPLVVDLQTIASLQTRQIKIWNAWPYNVTHLDTITSDNANGIQITGPALPYTIQPTQELTYTIEVGVDGPADIDAKYHFNFTETYNNISVDIVGSRIISVLWPYETPVQEVVNWKTEVITSNDGTEQRIRLRKHPRQGIQARYPMRYKNFAKLENRVYGWLSRRWAVPMWSEAQNVGALSSGITVINIQTIYCDFRVGKLVYIYDNEDNNFTVEIVTVNSNSIEIKIPIPSNYSNAWVMPSRIGRIINNPTKLITGYEGSVEFNFEFTDNLSLGLGTAPAQFLGEDIYYTESLLGEDTLSDVYSTRIDVIDYEVGNTSSFSPWKYIKKKRIIKYVLQGLSEIWTFRKWLHRRAGRQKPFWIPSFENDIRLQQSTPLASSIIVENNDYSIYSKDRIHIAIQLIDGSWLPRTIIGISPVDSVTLSISLDTTLSNLDPKLIKCISYLTLKRLDADKIDLQWLSNRTLTANIPVIEITP